MTMFKVTEKGFTLIEVIVALAILGAILGAMSAAILTIVRTNSQNNEWNTNMRQVQNAGYWISRDALMAQVVTTTKPGVFLALSWSDWHGNDSDIEYVFDGNTLRRQLNGGAAVLIADYVVTDAACTNCNWNDVDKKLTVKIRASINAQGRFAEKTYEISPRPAVNGG